MGLLRWLKRGESEQGRRLGEWKKAWAAAVQAADAGAVTRLRAELDALRLPEDDIEIEREMLDALEHLGTLTTAVQAAGLPAVETGHRAVGADICHFSAPVSMPDEPAQPAGRLLLTNARAIFVGSGGATAAWHTLAEAVQADRDLLLVHRDRERMYRFRCNSYSDALRATFLARQLIQAPRGGSGRP
jgi:ketosteroid isomerase-like protein